ncbi:ribose 5-phosphate isomerase, putative [Eimeria mitis]|uniref:ribose-5-phosphate isomerase n=1 Tax=Eimeria mitis TaxID=44415 RepID=U6KDC3_9EIME|nr:ribose 5-phosphate isomerase, putative [Eimeria mitis]CDJ36015.1 ribose 5-phosphate isomerase, putative [Eimeria mitis]
MNVGLGTGSTASFAVRRLAERIQQGELTNISCVSTSEETRKLAESLGISVFPLDGISLPLDVAIDGADEVLKTDTELVLIKGRGGALLREKLVEVQSKSFVCIVDEDKLVTENNFGTTGAVPLEIVKFGAQTTRRAVLAAVVAALMEGGPQGAPLGAPLGAPQADPEKAAQELGVSAVYRHLKGSNELFVSDNGNLCLDLFFKNPIKDPRKLHEKLIHVVGVVETGFFIGLSNLCIVGRPGGTTTRLAISQ